MNNNSYEPLQTDSEHISGRTFIDLLDLLKENIIITISGILITVAFLGALYPIYEIHKKVEIPESIEINRIVKNDDMEYTKEIETIYKSSADDVGALEIKLTDNNNDLTFLKDFTRLRRLELKLNDINSWKNLNSIPNMKNVEKLTIDINSYNLEQNFLTQEDLKFLSQFPNLRDLTLCVPSVVIPQGAIEYNCSSLQNITISNWKRDNILTDFTCFENLEEIHIIQSDADGVAISFSKEDYQKLKDMGVKVSIGTDKNIEYEWQKYEEYYNNLNLDCCKNDKEVVDTIIFGMVQNKIPCSSQNEAAKILRALTHIAGIEGKYLTNGSCIIELYESGKYYEVNPYYITQIYKNNTNQATNNDTQDYMKETNQEYLNNNSLINSLNNGFSHTK